MLEKNDERDKEDKMVIKKLQEDVIQMQKECKSEYNQNRQKERLAHTWFLEIAFVQEVGMRMCIHPGLLKTNHMK